MNHASCWIMLGISLALNLAFAIGCVIVWRSAFKDPGANHDTLSRRQVLRYHSDPDREEGGDS